MWRFLKKLSIFWSDGEDISSENVKSALTILEQRDEDDLVMSLNERKTCFKTGTITHLQFDYGLIDDKYYFSTTDPSVKALQVGIIVAFELYRTNDNEEWRVNKIHSIQDESWEENVNREHKEVVYYEDQEKEECGTRKTIVCQVINRKGRHLLFSPGNIECSLDDVATEFLPVEGDWVALEVIVEVSDELEDTEVNILKVEEICPLRSKVLHGTVTQLSPGGSDGVVNREVYFHVKDACEKGYVPQLNDKVYVQAMESEQHSLTWRALSLVPVIKENCVHPRTESFNAGDDILLENKNGVSVTENIDFGVLQKGETRDITVDVKNEGDQHQVLLYSKFHGRLSNSQLSVISPILQKPIVIYPKETLTFKFSCKARFIGKTSELYVFTFKGFKIGRYFNINVESTSLMNSIGTGTLNGKRNMQPPVFNTRRPNGVLVPGIRPVKSNPFPTFRMPQYEIPEKVWNVFSNNSHKEVLAALQSVLSCLYKDLTIQNYCDKFHALLYLEEVQMNFNIRNYQMTRANFQPIGGEFLSLEVPGLAEKRPSLIGGDRVIATHPWEDRDNPGTMFEGYIHKVFQKQVWLKFNANFHSSYGGEDYNISFHFGRSGLRLCHVGIKLAIKQLGPRVLFPSRIQQQPPQIEIKNEADISSCDAKNTGSNVNVLLRQSNNSQERKTLKWFNESLNDKQKFAVENILRGEARPLPYVIFGPPGTGKTITLVEVALQILHNISSSRLLVATPSNSSANLICERLLDSGILKPGDLVRLVSYHSMEEGSLPANLQPYCMCLNLQDRHGSAKNHESSAAVGRHRITVGTCIAIGQLHHLTLPPGHFTHVLVDEAGQATEPEIMVPLSFLHLHTLPGQVILAGDPLQLGPVVQSRYALEFGLGDSFLVRLLQRIPYRHDQRSFPDTGGYDPRLVTRLAINYRSLPELLVIPSNMFYDEDLIPSISETEGPEAELLQLLAEELPQRSSKRLPSIVFHGVRGTNCQEEGSPSWFNPQEMIEVVSYVTLLYDKGIEPESIGIITPYKMQVMKLRALMVKMELEVPKIGSVEEFQGQERPVIILSTVRSSSQLLETDIQHTLGFVASPRRLNVSLTRAKALLVILGNPHLLVQDVYWRTVLKYCVEHECYLGCDLPENLMLPAEDPLTV